jgi:DNA-directed RNA polymerase subunit K/omega
MKFSFLAEQFEDVEDREKILRIAYEEFEREYLSNIK